MFVDEDVERRQRQEAGISEESWATLQELLKTRPKRRRGKACIDCGTSIARKGRCFDCRNAYNRWRYHNDPEYRAMHIAEVNAARLKRQFGISQAEYDVLFDQQLGRCRICGATDERRALRVDHDHQTGKVRGLLCHKCNVGIGLFHDDNVLLLTAASYVERSI